MLEEKWGSKCSMLPPPPPLFGFSSRSLLLIGQQKGNINLRLLPPSNCLDVLLSEEISGLGLSSIKVSSGHNHASFSAFFYRCFASVREHRRRASAFCLLRTTFFFKFRWSRNKSSLITLSNSLIYMRLSKALLIYMINLSFFASVSVTNLLSIWFLVLFCFV
jgi:hypothetical protein